MQNYKTIQSLGFVSYVQWSRSCENFWSQQPFTIRMFRESGVFDATLIAYLGPQCFLTHDNAALHPLVHILHQGQLVNAVHLIYSHTILTCNIYCDIVWLDNFILSIHLVDAE